MGKLSYSREEAMKEWTLVSCTYVSLHLVLKDLHSLTSIRSKESSRSRSTQFNRCRILTRHPKDRCGIFRSYVRLPRLPFIYLMTILIDSAHAAAAPWEGQNALDAAFLAYSAVSVLRQQIKPDHRVHGIIEGKDWAANS